MYIFVGLKSFRIPSAVKVGSHNIIVLIIACSLVIGSPKCQQGGALARSNLCPAQRAVSMLKSPAGVCVQVRNGHHDCSSDCPLSLRAEFIVDDAVLIIIMHYNTAADNYFAGL